MDINFTAVESTEYIVRTVFRFPSSMARRLLKAHRQEPLEHPLDPLLLVLVLELLFFHQPGDIFYLSARVRVVYQSLSPYDPIMDASFSKSGRPRPDSRHLPVWTMPGR